MASQASPKVFKQLDAALGHPEEAEVLDLIGVRLAELPAEIGLLTRLHTLKICHSELTALPPEIRLCTALEHLDLTGNRLQKFPLHACGLPRLRNLRLTGNGLEEIPPQIGHLRGLEELALEHNALAGLPPHFGGLEQLRWLDLSDNPLAELPRETGALGQLKVLKLANGKLKTLPEELGYCAALEELDLANQQLTGLPELFVRLTQLRFLNLAGNSLEKLPVGLGALIHLRGLSLSRNRLAVLPDDLCQLARLEALDLSGNNLKEAPALLAQLAALQRLSLAGNELTSVPAALAGLPRLALLNLAVNRIAALPPAFKDAPGPLTVDLRDNPVTDLPEALFESGSLEVKVTDGWNGRFERDPLPVLKPGSPVASRAWLSNEAITVRLWLPLSARMELWSRTGADCGYTHDWPDFKLVRISVWQGVTYAALLADPYLPPHLREDPDFNPEFKPVHCLIVAEPGGTVRLADETACASVERLLHARPLPDAKTLRTQAEELWGVLPKRGSAEWYTAGAAERGLTEGLALKGTFLKDDTALALKDSRRTAANGLNLILSAATPQPVEDTLRVIHSIVKNGMALLCVRPATATLPDRGAPPAFLLRAAATGLEVLRGADWQKAARVVLDDLDRLHGGICADLSAPASVELDAAEKILLDLRQQARIGLPAPVLLSKPFDPETGRERRGVAQPGAPLRFARLWTERDRVFAILCHPTETPYVPEGARGWDLWVERVQLEAAATVLVLRQREGYEDAREPARFMVAAQSLDAAELLGEAGLKVWRPRVAAALEQPATVSQETLAALLAMPAPKEGTRCQLRLPDAKSADLAALEGKTVFERAALPATLAPSLYPGAQPGEAYRPLALVGQSFGGMKVTRFLSSGAFSAVYEAQRDQGTRLALKVARPPGRKVDWSPPPGAPVGKAEESPGWIAPTTVRTEARMLVTGGTTEVDLDARFLLYRQAQRLHAVNDPALVKAGRFSDDGTRCTLELEYAEGRTLRSLLKPGQPAPLQPLLGLARAMDRLLKLPGFPYHGDLKPDNVLHAAGRIVIIDPGYFGPVETAQGHVLPQAAVTTPDYYPLLQPDDLFAFGLMLWEAATGTHPLANGPTSSAQADQARCGSKLLAQVRGPERVGQYFLSPLLGLHAPAASVPGLRHELEAVLFKALGLTLRKDGKLDVAPAYTSFAEMAAALEPLV